MEVPKKNLDNKDTEIATSKTNHKIIQNNPKNKIIQKDDSNHQVIQNNSILCDVQIIQQSYVQESPKVLTEQLNEVYSILEEVKPKEVKSIDGRTYHSQQLGLKVPPKQTLDTRDRLTDCQAREEVKPIDGTLDHSQQLDLKVPPNQNLDTRDRLTDCQAREEVKPIDGTLDHSQQLHLKVPPNQNLDTRDKILDHQSREVIHNVIKFMRDEAKNGITIPLGHYRERLLRATGISSGTYHKVITKKYRKVGPPPSKKIKHDSSNPSFKEVDVTIDNGDTVSESDSIYRPKINRDASTPDGVYNLEDFVEASVLDTLAVEAGKIIEAGSADKFELCQFATANINKLLKSNSSANRSRSITIFLYVHYLIKFIQTPLKDITKIPVCDKSIDVNNHILKLFSKLGANEIRTRSFHMKDKALCYTMILAAIAMEFEVDLALLSRDWKGGMKKLVELAKILAFSKKAKTKNVVQLKLPLPAAYTPKRVRKIVPLV